MTSSDMQDTPAGRRADGPRSSQPKRRTFTAAYKLAMIEKYDAATGPGAKGALLRGEGLYDSHISCWRKARGSGSLASSAAAADAVPAVAHKGRPAAEAENERLRKRLAKAEVKLGQTRAALDIMGKRLRFGAALRERGFAGAVRQVSEDTFDLLEPVTGVKKACELTGKSRATVYRRRGGTLPGCRERRPAAPNALSAGEREELLAVLDGPRFAGKAPRQVWALLIDEGLYLASVSTMYRLLRKAGQVSERRAQAAHPARRKPELIATRPDQVRSWDITKLAGPQRGVYYHLYVMTDIFSRCAVHFEVHATELGELAKDFMTEAVRLNGGTAPLAIHADRGTSMTSRPVPALLSDLAILKSHSRPKVSNDNPYSEAQFKTLKYCPAFPGTFGSLQDARAFCGVFFTYYNHEHRHSGIALHTPYSVHIGTAAAIQDKRQAVLNAACAANPRRFTRRPKAPALPVTAWINKPVTDSDITQHPSQEAA